MRAVRMTTVPPDTVLSIMSISLDTIERTRLYLVETLQVGDSYADRQLNARFTRDVQGRWEVEVAALAVVTIADPEDAVAYAIQAAEREHTRELERAAA